MERHGFRVIGAVLPICALLTFPAVSWGDGPPLTGIPASTTSDRISLGRSSSGLRASEVASTQIRSAAERCGRPPIKAGLDETSDKTSCQPGKNSSFSNTRLPDITPGDVTGMCTATGTAGINGAPGSGISAMLASGSYGPVFAQASPAKVPEIDRGKKNCLWRVKSEKSTLYILGSVHLLRKESYPLHAAVEESFDLVRKLAFEVDMDIAEKPSTFETIMSKGMYGPGGNLRSSVSPETYELAGKRTAELGMSLERMEKFKPWLLSITVAAGKLLMLGFDPALGVDRHFYRKAKKAGKPIIPLETIEYQISRFDEMEPKTQEAMLLQTLKDLEILEKEFNTIVECWESGDAASMEALMLKSFEHFPEVYEKLIVERNRNWLPRIEELLEQSEPCMVVVGALHLVGKDGIIEMLRQKGHSVEQL